MAISQCDFLILVAEDNEMNQRVIRAILDKSGFKYAVVTDGNAAVASYESGSFDLILMDCQMPHLDGIKATRRIRQLEKSKDLRRIPIVALTANSMKGDREICLDAGMDDFLSKPFRMNDLVNAIKKWQGISHQ